MKIDTENLGRIFLFIDETGDPGRPDQRDASRFYQLNIVATDRRGIRDIVKHFSRFRYFQEADKELENYGRSFGKLCDLFQICSERSNIDFFSFFLKKESYTGPYLKNVGDGKYDYNPAKFRNFIVRKSLETVFGEILPEEYAPLFQSGLEVEVVFDRYLVSEEEEQGLRDYLRGNYNLPPFLHIVQVDSEYSDLVQTADLLGKLVKRSMFDGKDISLDFVSLFCLENPNMVEKRKGPGHPQGAPDPSHL